MNYIDKNVTFKYIRNSPIQYFKGQHIDNLADVLAYYIYILNYLSIPSVIIKLISFPIPNHN